MNFTSFISVWDLGLGDAIVLVIQKIILFAANVLYTIVDFGIDVITDPVVAGPVVAIIILAVVWKRRATKKVM